VESEGNKCPACRRSYNPDHYVHVQIKAEDLSGSSSKGKSKARGNIKADSDNRKALTNIRVVQRNLVYVTNLSLDLAKEEVLRKHEYFGQYGKIAKMVVNRSNVYQGSSVSCYVTYKKPEEAYRCIETVDGCLLNDKVLRASFGTTKYCSYFLRNRPCTNPDCMYLHELGDEKDSFTKEDMQAGKHLSRVPAPQASHQIGRSYGLPPPRSALRSSMAGSINKPSTTLTTSTGVQASKGSETATPSTGLGAASQAAALPQNNSATWKTQSVGPSVSHFEHRRNEMGETTQSQKTARNTATLMQQFDDEFSDDEMMAEDAESEAAEMRKSSQIKTAPNLADEAVFPSLRSSSATTTSTNAHTTSSHNTSAQNAAGHVNRHAQHSKASSYHSGANTATSAPHTHSSAHVKQHSGGSNTSSGSHGPRGHHSHHSDESSPRSSSHSNSHQSGHGKSHWHAKEKPIWQPKAVQNNSPSSSSSSSTATPTSSTTPAFASEAPSLPNSTTVGSAAGQNFSTATSGPTAASTVSNSAITQSTANSAISQHHTTVGAVDSDFSALSLNQDALLSHSQQTAMENANAAAHARTSNKSPWKTTPAANAISISETIRAEADRAAALKLSAGASNAQSLALQQQAQAKGSVLPASVSWASSGGPSPALVSSTGVSKPASPRASGVSREERAVGEVSEKRDFSSSAHQPSAQPHQRSQKGKAKTTYAKVQTMAPPKEPVFDAPAPVSTSHADPVATQYASQANKEVISGQTIDGYSQTQNSLQSSSNLKIDTSTDDDLPRIPFAQSKSSSSSSIGSPEDDETENTMVPSYLLSSFTGFVGNQPSTTSNTQSKLVGANGATASKFSGFGATAVPGPAAQASATFSAPLSGHTSGLNPIGSPKAVGTRSASRNLESVPMTSNFSLPPSSTTSEPYNLLSSETWGFSGGSGVTGLNSGAGASGGAWSSFSSGNLFAPYGAPGSLDGLEEASGPSGNNLGSSSETSNARNRGRIGFASPMDAPMNSMGQVLPNMQHNVHGATPSIGSGRGNMGPMQMAPPGRLPGPSGGHYDFPPGLFPNTGAPSAVAGGQTAGNGNSTISAIQLQQHQQQQAMQAQQQQLHQQQLHHQQLPIQAQMHQMMTFQQQQAKAAAMQAHMHGYGPQPQRYGEGGVALGVAGVAGGGWFGQPDWAQSAPPQAPTSAIASHNPNGVQQGQSILSALGAGGGGGASLSSSSSGTIPVVSGSQNASNVASNASNASAHISSNLPPRGFQPHPAQWMAQTPYAMPMNYDYSAMQAAAAAAAAQQQQVQGPPHQ
jgi:hypothetical protein